MIDYLWTARQELIGNFQSSLKAIRLLMGYSVIELADFVGVTRQTINNLETGKSKMSAVQFLALAAVVDNYIVMNEDMYPTIAAILDGRNRRTASNWDSSFNNHSLLSRWFLLFSTADSESVPSDTVPLEAVQLQQIIRQYKIFLDDTALLNENAVKFIYSLASSLSAENEKVIIPLRAIEQIQAQAQKNDCSKQAVSTLHLLNWMQKKGIVQIRGEVSDTDLHDTIMSVFLKFRGIHRLCLITQDEAFATQVLRLNKTKSQEGFDISVGYIGETGKLTMYSSEGSASTSDLTKLTSSTALSVGSPELDTDQKSDESFSGWEYL